MQVFSLHLRHFKFDSLYKTGTEAMREAEGYKNCVDLSRSGGNFFAHSGELVNDYKARGGETNYRKLFEKELDKYTHFVTRKRRGRGGRPSKVRVYNDDNTAVRKNANWMSGMVITLDMETVRAWGEERAKNYFAACSGWLENRYGHRVADPVHVDESSWHMQYALAPIKNGHLDSNDIFDRKEVRYIQDRLPIYLRSLGYDVQRGIRGGKKEYLKTVGDLKRQTTQHAGLVIKGVDDCIDIFNNAEKKEPSFLDKVKGNDTTRYVVDEKDFLSLVDTAKVSVAAVAKAEAEKKRADAAVLSATLSTEKMVKAQDNASNYKYTCEVLNRQNAELEQQLQHYKDNIALLDKAAGGDVNKLLEDYEDMQQQLDVANGRIERLKQLQEQELEQEREKYKELEQELHKQQAAHEQLQKDFKHLDGITDNFYDLLKKYPTTMHNVLQRYADDTGKTVEYYEGGVCIGSAKSRVRELGPEVEIN